MKRLNLIFAIVLALFLAGLHPFSAQAQCLSSDLFTTSGPLSQPPWFLPQDINTTTTGSQISGGTTLIITAEGTGIGLGGDSFRYIYQEVSGDSDITLNVLAVPNADANLGICGLMMREVPNFSSVTADMVSICAVNG